MNGRELLSSSSKLEGTGAHVTDALIINNRADIASLDENEVQNVDRMFHDVPFVF